MRPRRPLLVTVATGALLFGTALPAAAHPAFSDGASAPAGSLTTLTLAIAHGCGTEDEAGGDPTLEVAVEVPDAVSYIVANPVDGYEPGAEGDGEVPDVVTWTATGAGEPAPAVSMDVVVDGEPGDELYVRVFQACDGFEYRWIGTPEEPADDPAVRLTLGAPDPDAPAPPPPPAPERPEADTEADTQADTEEPTPPAVEELPTEPPADEGGGPGWWPIVLGALALAGLGGLIGSRRRSALDPTAEDDPAGAPDRGGPPTR